MKTMIIISIIVVTVGLINPLPVFGDTIDEEVLVLFETGILIMPSSRITVSLEEINAPPEVLSMLQSINVLEISKGFPDFDPKDTLKINPDGLPARLPDFSNLYVLRLSIGTDRYNAILELENLPEVIYAEKNQRVYAEFEPNDPLKSSQWCLGENYIGAYHAFDFSRGSSSTKIGTNEMPIMAANYAAGIYFISIETDEDVITEKFIMLK